MKIKKFKFKIKKFKFIVFPVQIQPIRPVLGRIYAVIVLLKCIKLFRFNAYGYKFYRISLPKIEWVGD